MTKLYLVRHGETVDNVRQILQGQMQGQLNGYYAELERIKRNDPNKENCR